MEAKIKFDLYEGYQSYNPRSRLDLDLGKRVAPNQYNPREAELNLDRHNARVTK